MATQEKSPSNAANVQTGSKQNATANIPKELKQLNQWVCWKAEQHEGKSKSTKVLKNPRTGANAKTNDLTTWATFDDALRALAYYSLDGIGFVFTKDDPYCGIDLDNCRDPETEEIEPWAQALIDQVNSYTEISPSGRGVHIIVKGALPPGGNRKGDVEMYDSARYFTMTGRVLSDEL